MIEFLLNNPFLIVIIIGAITSFLGKSKQEKKGSATEPVKTFPPRTIQQETEQPLQKPSSTEQPVVQKKTVVEVVQKEKKAVMTESHSGLQSQQTAKTKALQKEMDHLQHVLTKKQATVATNIPTRNITKSNVVDGIIWSEILGPPRAKKPYHFSKNRG
ncbi:hypothetical protein OEV98_10145 [Caldibacillus lycopersici]|uniref:Uncharacterized protein n=1 Tax=Perspicuibacillus lycopersici TaxID=1325689 RepID=A0AAE3IT25_9BACI|nr:hypothetical protein [Perspicuibacillus lycopersici]MCU9613921.1 hypothetical protein [Perspicuibacillus lycopersici]